MYQYRRLYCFAQLLTFEPAEITERFEVALDVGAAETEPVLASSFIVL